MREHNDHDRTTNFQDTPPAGLDDTWFMPEPSSYTPGWSLPPRYRILGRLLLAALLVGIGVVTCSPQDPMPPLDSPSPTISRQP